MTPTGQHLTRIVDTTFSVSCAFVIQSQNKVFLQVYIIDTAENRDENIQEFRRTKLQ